MRGGDQGVRVLRVLRAEPGPDLVGRLGHLDRHPGQLHGELETLLGSVGEQGRKLCFALYAASKAAGNAYRALLAPLGLTYPQYLVMPAIWAGEGSTVAEVGAEVGLETSTLSPLLKRLEQAGFITRGRDARDERVVRLHLTEAGAGLEDAVRGVRERVEAATRLSAAEMADLRGRLLRLKADLEAAEFLN